MAGYYPDESGPIILTRMLNDALSTTFAPEDIVYETPRVIDKDGRNTKLPLRVVQGPMTGRRSICYYNRLDLARLIGNLSASIVDTGALNRVEDVLAIIRERYGYALTTDDIVNSNIVINGYPTTVVLEAKPDSYLVYGSVSVDIVENGSDTPIPESGLFRDTDMPVPLFHSSWQDDSDYPEALLSGRQGHFLLSVSDSDFDNLIVGMKVEEMPYDVVPVIGEDGVEAYNLAMDEYGDTSANPYVRINVGSTDGVVSDLFEIAVSHTFNAGSESQKTLEYQSELQIVPNFLAEVDKFTVDSNQMILENGPEKSYLVTLDSNEVNEIVLSSGVNLVPDIGAGLKFHIEIITPPDGLSFQDNFQVRYELLVDGNAIRSSSIYNWTSGGSEEYALEDEFSGGVVALRLFDLSGKQGLQVRIRIPELAFSDYVIKDAVVDGTSVPADDAFPCFVTESSADLRAVGLYLDVPSWAYLIDPGNAMVRDGNSSVIGRYDTHLTAKQRSSDSTLAISISGVLSCDIEPTLDELPNCRLGPLAELPFYYTGPFPLDPDETIYGWSTAKWLVVGNSEQEFVLTAQSDSRSFGFGYPDETMGWRIGTEFDNANLDSEGWYIIAGHYSQAGEGAYASISDVAGDSFEIELIELVNLDPAARLGPKFERGGHARFSVTQENTGDPILLKLLETNQVWTLDGTHGFASDDQTAVFVRLDKEHLAAAFPSNLDGNGCLIGTYRVIVRQKAGGETRAKASFRVFTNSDSVPPDNGGGGDGSVGRFGFAMAASNRMFLADKFDAGVEITDESVPTGYQEMVAGKNGEIWAFKNEEGLLLAYSNDSGNAGSWETYAFEPGTFIDPAKAVFFQGHVYAIITEAANPYKRFSRLRNTGEGWEWVTVLEDLTLSNAATYVSNDDIMVVSSGNNLYITSNGIDYDKENLRNCVIGGQAVTLSNHSVAIRSDGTIVGTADGTGGYWNSRLVTFVRRGANDYDFQIMEFYPSDATHSFARSGRINTFAVKNRLFVILQTAVKVGNMWTEPVKGAVWYTDAAFPASVADWTESVANSGMVDQTFAYDGERILLVGRKATADSGNWAGLSHDDGATWAFDQDTASAFGQLRDEVYPVVRRGDDGVTYPVVIDPPPLVTELLSEPSEFDGGGRVNSVIPTLSNGFLVVGNFTKAGGYIRNGIYKYNSDGTLSEQFDCNLTAGGNYDEGDYANSTVVMDAAETADGSYVIVGEFTAVDGVAANGIAWVDAVAGTRLVKPNLTWLSASSQPALLSNVAVDSQGRIYVGGSFVSVDGHNTVGVARLLSDGSVDTSFTSGLTATSPTSLRIGLMKPCFADKLLVDGVFSTGYTVVLNNDGSIDTDFPVTGATIESAIAVSDDKVEVFGWGLSNPGGMRITLTNGVYTTDSGFMIHHSTDTWRCGGKMSDGTYVFEDKSFVIDGVTYHRPYFTAEDGSEVGDYSRIFTRTTLGGTMGAFTSVSKDGTKVLITGQFQYLYQSTYPRYASVRRPGLAIFAP